MLTVLLIGGLLVYRDFSDSCGGSGGRDYWIPKDLLGKMVLVWNVVFVW